MCLFNRSFYVTILMVGLCGWFFFSQSVYADSSAPVRMYFFYSEDCEECLAIKNDFLPRLNRKYPSSLKVKYLEMNDPKIYGLMTELEGRYGRELKNPPPTIFIDDQVLDGKEEVKERLEEIIKDSILKGGCAWPDEKRPEMDSKDENRAETKDAIVEKFKNLGVLAVIGGGLVDGINPCAFTTLIFFISYLAFVGRKGREIILVGGAFTTAIFITYLLIGVGLFEFIRRITILPSLSHIVSLLVAGGAVLLGILSLYDYYQIKAGRTKYVKLQLSKTLKKRIHGVIRRGSKTRHYVLGAFFIGFLISFLELACTGQVYFPVILVLRHVSELRIYALFYLILYNLMFILPLIVVFILAYYGLTPEERLAKLTQKHLGKTKILLAILFFGLAGLLIVFNL